MSDTARNLIQMAVSSVASAGLGTLTLGSAVADYLAFEAGDDGLTFTVTITETGVGQEVNTGCTYTHSGTTLTRGTLEKSTTGAAIAFSSAAIVSVTASADSGRRWNSAALTHVAGADSATTMAVGNLYVVDGATLTADRTYTLPATAAVGDRIGVMMSAGSDSYEVLITAASGDTLNGVAGGTEWSRLFITGEVVIMRCVAASAAWVVEQDGRIPQLAKMYLSTAADGESASTYTRPTAAPTPGAWTDEYDNANLTSPADDRIYSRRAGTFVIAVAYVPKDSGTVGQFVNLEVRRNGVTVLGGPSTIIQTAGVNRINATLTASIPAGEYVDYYYRTGDGGIGANASAAWVTTFSIAEVL